MTERIMRATFLFLMLAAPAVGGEPPSTEERPTYDLWLGAGLGGGALLASEQVWSGITRLEAGWMKAPLYARLSIGFTTGSGLGQSFGAETTAGVGWVALPWLEVGGQIGRRISSADPGDPWSDRAWFGGLWSAQCLAELGLGLTVCVEEAASGGRWSRRAVDINDRLVFVPRTDEATLRLDLGVALRREL